MDDRYTLAAARYIELNPVRAGLVSRADDYPWSSARAHLTGRDDLLAQVGPLLERVPDWAGFLGGPDATDAANQFRKHQSTGRPLGSETFIDDMEVRLGRALRPRKGGRRPKASQAYPT